MSPVLKYRKNSDKMFTVTKIRTIRDLKTIKYLKKYLKCLNSLIGITKAD